MSLAGSQSTHGLGSDPGFHKAAPTLSSKSQRGFLEPSCDHLKDISAGVQHPKAACLLIDYPPALRPPLEGTESWSPLFASCLLSTVFSEGCCLEPSRIPIAPSLHLTLVFPGSSGSRRREPFIMPFGPAPSWAIPEFSPASYWGSSARGSTQWRYTGIRHMWPESHVDTHRTLEISFSEEHTCQEGAFLQK